MHILSYIVRGEGRRSSSTSNTSDVRVWASCTSLVAVVFILLSLSVPLVSSAQTLRYGYDVMGRLTQVVYGDGTVVEYVYDNLGNRLIQSITLPGAPSNQPPAAVTNPGIPDGATNVTLTPTLSWNAASDPNPGDVVGYYVYFGRSPNPPLAFSGSATNWSPGQLQALTTYYWYVVARDNHNAQSTSATWSFTTTYFPPVADFSASATNGSAPLTVSFYDRSSCSDDTIVSWSWDFNNDGIIDSTLQNPTYTFTSGGNYTVTLTVGTPHVGIGTVTKTNFISLLGSNVVDLAPTSLNVDLAASYRHLEVRYSITNLGTETVSGQWQWADVFYVSTNPVLDSSAIPIATFYENQSLPAGGGYSRTNLVTIPSGAGQNYYLILKADGNFGG